MLISGIQSSSSLLTELNASSVSSTSSNNNQNAFDTALKELFSAVESGDTEDAQTYLTQVQQLTPSNADANSPLGQLLSTLSTDLSNNDISSAQSALQTFQSQAPPPLASTDSTSSTTSGSSSSDTLSELAQDVVSLFSAISSGDLSSAQSAYDDLTSLLLGSSSTSTDSSSSSTSSTDSSSSSDSSFSSLLQNIGKALSSGDIDSAQNALNSFLQSLSSGSLISTSA
jgi:ribosomal protein S20